MRIKQLLTKTLLATVGLCVGASAWAETTSLYERGTTNAWSDADLTDWTSAYCTPTIDGGLSVTTKNAGWTNTKSISVTANSIVTLDATLKTGGAPGRSGSYDYIKIGGVTVGFNEQDQKAFVEVDGTTTDLSLTYSRATAYAIQVVINQATGAVSYTVGAVKGLSSSSTAITGVEFGHNKAGKENYGITAVLQKIEVSEEQQEVTTADYTINYQYGGKTIASDTGTEVVGGVVYAASSKTVDGVKYIVDGGQTTSLTITSGTNTLDLTVSKAAQYTHIAQAVDADNNVLNANIASVTAYEGDGAVLTWSKYIQDGEGNWYIAANNTYRKKVTEGGTTNVTYNASDIAYFFEFDGIYNTRADNESNGSAQGGSAEVIVPADGVYIITANCYGSAANRTATIKVGETEIVGATTIGIYAPGTDLISNAIALEKDDVITVTTSDSKSGIDYVILKKASFSPAVEDYATFSSEFALDFSAATGVKAYYASASDGSTVTMTKVTGAVAAGTGLLLQKTDGAISIPTAANGTDLSATNLLKAGTGAAVKTEGTTHRYVLAGEGDATSFYELAASADAVVIPEGKAYLEVVNAGARLKISFSDDETTGIANVEKTSAVAEGIYNLNGQRVAAPQKGLYIVNGKKVIKK